MSKRSHRVRFAGHGAVCLVAPIQNDIWAERLIQTLLREWAYGRPYRTNDERVTAPSTSSISDDPTPRSAVDHPPMLSATSLDAARERRGNGRGERRQTTLRHLNVPASLPLEIEVTGTERWLRGSLA
jgi:hypothetical protein